MQLNSQTIATVNEPTEPAYKPFGDISPTWFFGGSVLVFTLIFVANAVFGSGNKKNVIGSARWGGSAEKRMARKTAIAQLTSPRHDEVALWINSPGKIEGTKISNDKDTVWLPYMANGTAVIGGSGSGKSYSVIIQTLRAAIAQGLPTILLDTDYPGLSKTIAPLAESVGYDVDIFAPGYRESGVCNVLDFVSDCRDSTGASQISKTLNKNFALSGRDEDVFFKVAGELATEAALLLAKALPHKDLLTAFTVLKDEDMIDRVRGVGRIDPWLSISFGQLLSTAKSEKTVDSIRGTAALLFGNLMRPDILPALIGDTTIPLKVTGKRLLIFGVKQDIRLVVSPLIASIIHAIITTNVLPGRKEPLFLSLDEMPSMFFPEISEWLSEKRKYGLCCQIGYQSLAQLKKTYGPELASVIYTNTATKFLFNPQHVESAELFSRTLGDKDIIYHTKSRTYGKNRSRTRGEHRIKRRLWSSDEFLTMGQGSCVLLNPGYGKGRERFIPMKFDPIKISKKEIALQQATEDRWNEFLSSVAHKSVGDRKIPPHYITEREEALHKALPRVKSPSSPPDYSKMLS